MSIIIDLSTPENMRKFTEAYLKALAGHDPNKPFDLEKVANDLEKMAKDADVIEPERPRQD